MFAEQGRVCNGRKRVADLADGVLDARGVLRGGGRQGRRRVNGREGAAWEHFSSAMLGATERVRPENAPRQKWGGRGGYGWRLAGA